MDMLTEKPLQANGLPASRRMGIVNTAYVLELNSFCLIYKTYLKSDINVSKSFDQFKILIHALELFFVVIETQLKLGKHESDITGSHN